MGSSPGSDLEDSLPPGPPLAMGPTEDLAPALRRMALEQLRVVAQGFDAVEDDLLLDHNVHLARKAGKRLRGLFRLCRYELGIGRYRCANALVRDQARRLSDIRTSAVVQLTLAELVADGSLATASIGDLHDLLAKRHSQGLLKLRTDSDARYEAQETLGKLADLIEGFPAPPGYQERNLTALEPAIRRIYRRGRRAMRRAELLDTATAFHDWRKRVNYLRFQMEALRGACDPAIDALAEALSDLAELLGTEHDLADLREAIGSTPVAIPDSLANWIDTRTRVLREEALRRGSALFAKKPSDFIRFFAEHSDARP